MILAGCRFRARLRAASLLFSAILFVGHGAAAQDAPAAVAPKAASGAVNAEFQAAAGEVLGQMSKITHLSLQTPLKKTLRSREEIRAYVLRRMKEDKTEAERYAGERSAQAFGLVPKDFKMEPFLVELLTEQIAGLYDPQGREFYVADWIPLSDQRIVMAHELTHALEDQHFAIERWSKAAQPNDDAELAREAVLEGSATAAMIDYMLKDMGQSLRTLPNFDPEVFMGDLETTPTLAKAPPFIKDALLFPYFAGLQFTKDALQDGGWDALPALFAKPPLSTQQILHPQLYRQGRAPSAVELPVDEKLLRGNWKKLDENTLGEFGWREVLQQFLGKARAVPLAGEWSGDHYLLFEEPRSKRLLLVCRVRLASAGAAARFFGQYSEALEKKHDSRSNLLRRPNFFSFDTPNDGGVFLRCLNADCLVVEGSGRAAFDAINKAIGWPTAPSPSGKLPETPERTARIPAPAAAENAGMAAESLGLQLAR
jgi:hypothetical protein